MLANHDAEATAVHQLKPTPESLGVLVAFLAREAPFSTFHASVLVGALQDQLAMRTHAALVRGNRLVAYCGWLHTTKDIGERWARGDGELTRVSPEISDAVACTIVSCPDRKLLGQLIRAARMFVPGKEAYFERRKPDGVRRRSRVRNMSFP